MRFGENKVPPMWANISLVNFLIVALIGVIMRYKIEFEFPWLDQKHLQLSHSHFAFYGWVSHTIMILMISYIARFSKKINVTKYTRFIYLNLFAAYGMLVSFFLLGYHLISISFAVLALIVSYFFTWFFLRDFKTIQIKSGASIWFRAALLSSVISSIGTYALAYMMVTHKISQTFYLLAVYFYLHFQYNGWFFFSIVGLALLLFRTYLPDFIIKRYVFWMFAISCIPSYFLSALWVQLPGWMYFLLVLSAIIQLVAWVMLLKQFVYAYKQSASVFSPVIRWLFLFLASAVSIKFCLQLGSVIPELSKLAFGFRTIIIAYLHLVLLAIVSLFLLAYLFQLNYIYFSKRIQQLFLYLIGMIYLNEAILAIQGFASFSYLKLPYWNELLFLISIGIFFGILMLWITQKTRDSFNS